MNTPCLVGSLTANDPITVAVRYVHSHGHPDDILLSLDRIWSSTCARDTAKLVELLLGHQWSYLDAAVTADTAVSFTGEQPVPGVGMANKFDAASHFDLIPPLSRFNHVRWVVYIDAAHHTVSVCKPDNLAVPLIVHHLPAPARAANPPGTSQTPDLLAAVRLAAITAGRRIADAWAEDTFADQSTGRPEPSHGNS